MGYPRPNSAESPALLTILFPVPGGLLPRRHLRPLSGIFPHVADREPLGLDLLPHFLLSHLECIRFRPTRQVLMANRQSEVFDVPNVASTCASAAPSNTSSDGCLAHQSRSLCSGNLGAPGGIKRT